MNSFFNNRSNPTISHSLTDSKHGVLPGHPGPPLDTLAKSNKKEEKVSTPFPVIPGGKHSVLGNFKPTKDLRYRYDSSIIFYSYIKLIRRKS